MTKLTKIELQQALNTIGAEVEALRLENAQLKATLAMRPAAKPARPAYVPSAPTAQQLAIRASMTAARELAMRSGVSVRVSV
jgi:regulator of replication initiation timing